MYLEERRIYGHIYICIYALWRDLFEGAMMMRDLVGVALSSLFLSTLASEISWSKEVSGAGLIMEYGVIERRIQVQADEGSY